MQSLTDLLKLYTLVKNTNKIFLISTDLQKLDRNRLVSKNGM